jgi:hypothetical protein
VRPHDVEDLRVGEDLRFLTRRGGRAGPVDVLEPELERVLADLLRRLSEARNDCGDP